MRADLQGIFSGRIFCNWLRNLNDLRQVLMKYYSNAHVQSPFHARSISRAVLKYSHALNYNTPGRVIGHNKQLGWLLFYFLRRRSNFIAHRKSYDCQSVRIRIFRRHELPLIGNCHWLTFWITFLIALMTINNSRTNNGRPRPSIVRF